MPLSVLLVDDDTDFRKLARRMLVDLGLIVVGDVGTVADAIAAATQLAPDAALIDIGLPDGTGLMLADEMQALSCTPRVVLTSTDPDAAPAAEIRRVGAVGFLPKEELVGEMLHHLLVGDGAPHA
jgi:CheY-like chemotaxis protein